MAHKTLIVRLLTWIAYSMLNFILFCTSSRIVVISQVFNLADLTAIIWPEEKKKEERILDTSCEIWAVAWEKRQKLLIPTTVDSFGHGHLAYPLLKWKK